jgi:hypothetical protein
MVRKSPAQLDRDIAEALSRTPGSTAPMTHGTSIDTTTTLERKFRSRQRDALTLSEKARQARGAAARWMKRSSAYAREGEFRAADDAQTEAVSLGQMATDLETEAVRIRTRSHATMKTIAAPVHHDRLATAIARAVRDPHYWRGGSFDIDDAMQALPKLQGAYDWQRVLDLVDDYLEGVAGVAGATGGGFPERATRGVGGHEVKAVQAMIQRLRRVSF